jgi:hypothetical protein
MLFLHVFCFDIVFYNVCIVFYDVFNVNVPSPHVGVSKSINQSIVGPRLGLLKQNAVVQI